MKDAERSATTSSDHADRGEATPTPLAARSWVHQAMAAPASVVHGVTSDVRRPVRCAWPMECARRSGRSHATAIARRNERRGQPADAVLVMSLAQDGDA